MSEDEKAIRMQKARDYVPGTMIFPRDPTKDFLGFGRDEIRAVHAERELAERVEAQRSSPMAQEGAITGETSPETPQEAVGSPRNDDSVPRGVWGRLCRWLSGS